VRKAIREAVPQAEEMISYKMPAYKLKGQPLIFFAAWSKHFSIYPASNEMAAKFKKDLEPYQISKGTIRFPLSEPVPVKLIERLVRFRAKGIK